MKSHLQSALAVVATVGASAAHAATPFDWTTITPSTDLEYHDCYDSYKCARLSLPLDWQDESSTATVAIAIIKSDAVVGLDDPTYGGPILSNPGGPGGSGVGALLGSAALQREMVDTPGQKHFEYVSFDPRGVGFSTPLVNCYRDSKVERAAMGLKTRGSGGLNGGPASLPYGLGLAQINGARCEQANGDLLKYVGTPSVARDTVAIVDKIDAYNKKNSKKQQRAVMERARLQLQDNSTNLPRLQYLGFSYGTALGNYFASLFPGRVGRLLLDGVVDIDDYVNGVGWLSNTVDLDKIVDQFFDGCFNAGKAVCPLVHDGDKSGSDVSKRVWAWIEGLDANPTIASKGDKMLVLRSDDIHFLLINSVYKPVFTFKDAAGKIANAMQGNTTALYDYINATSGGPIEDTCKPGPAPPAFEDAEYAILCGDGEDVTGHDASFWRAYLDKQLAQSSVAGARWSNLRLACANWKTKAKWQFRGPFTTPAPSANCSAPEPGRPAAPIFFLSNRYDPVTPLRAAHKVASKYPGSALLIQEAMGHTVFSQRMATDCTKNAIRQYFADGVVPSKKTTCKAACDPWGAPCHFTGTPQVATAAFSVNEEFQVGEYFPLHL